MASAGDVLGRLGAWCASGMGLWDQFDTPGVEHLQLCRCALRGAGELAGPRMAPWQAAQGREMQKMVRWLGEKPQQVSHPAGQEVPVPLSSRTHVKSAQGKDDLSPCFER